MSKDKIYMSKRNFFQIPAGAKTGLELSVKHCRTANINQWIYPESIHPCWFLYWNPDPGAGIRCDGRTWEMDAGQVFLIPPFTRFSTRSEQKFRHFFIHFEASAPFDRVQRGILTFPSRKIREFFRRLDSKTIPESFPALLHELICHYLGLIPQEQFADPGTSILDPRIQRAAELISAHMKRPLSNRELSRKACMNLNDFYHRFRQGLGVSPKQYLLASRMEIAREKLLHTACALDEIAEQCGYADRFQFTKAFRKFFGLPPATYRKKYQV